MKYILALIAMFLFSGCTEVIKTKKKFEPSGITKLENDIYVVSDNGEIARIDLKTKKIEYRHLGKIDLEAITTNGKDLFMMDEKNQEIIVLDGSIYKINPYYENKLVLNPEGNNLESLTYISEDEDYLYFYGANQSKEFSGDDASSIVKLEVSKQTFTATIVEYRPMKIKDISDIQYVSDEEIYIISDKENMIWKTNKNFELVNMNFLQGENQEGILIDGKNTYIAQDSGDILILKGE